MKVWCLLLGHRWDRWTYEQTLERLGGPRPGLMIPVPTLALRPLNSPTPYAPFFTPTILVQPVLVCLRCGAERLGLERQPRARRDSTRAP